MSNNIQDNDPPPHILWLFVMKLLKAVGPEKGRRVLAETTDLLKEEGVWPHVLEHVTDTLSDAYVYAAGLKDEETMTHAVISHLNEAYAMDHLAKTISEAGPDGMKVVELEIERMKEMGYLPSNTTIIPLMANMDSPEAFREAMKAAGFEMDEWDATKGCGCPRCTEKRSQGEDQGYNPDLH